MKRRVSIMIIVLALVLGTPARSIAYSEEGAEPNGSTLRGLNFMRY